MRGFRKGRLSNNILDDYIAVPGNENNGWKDEFYTTLASDDRDRLKNEIITDQAGLCAYYEKALRDEGDNKPLGFKVEHFIPENSKTIKEKIAAGQPAPTTNYSLLWTNLLGCCFGGEHPRSASYDKSLTDRTNLSCDVPKSNHNWSELILDPSQQPPDDGTWFEFDEDGLMYVSADCPTQYVNKARQSIEMLNLNCVRLTRLRLAALESLSTISDEADIAALLSKDAAGIYGEFISLRKWYLA
ncbi:retron system putative HNH endonuclease [Klebsiella pneumoniae]|nr:TIGR02646 family protein [Klebsiella pneumoniae]